MQAHTTAPNTAPKPLGNFEIAPEFNDDPQPNDVVYEYFHGIHMNDSESFIGIRSLLLRGIQRPESYVVLEVVAGKTYIKLDYSPELARTLARKLLAAADDADDADAAHAVLCAEQQGGVA
ncbi:hypothetical protein ACSLNH_02190 [Comamonas kerstersii]|uniref:hypothetical protein n=1 Tax=Comamonas kerstersii TaxID=225992 RepID=UPI003EE0BA18